MENGDRENYLQLALQYFEKNEYEKAVVYFIAAYQEGDERECILQFLKDCFVNPNQEEFAIAYEKTRKCANLPEYNELECMFIPVSEGKYYVFNEVVGVFDGIIDIDYMNRDKDVVFDSLVIADFFTVQELYETCCEKNWKKIYCLLDKKSKLGLSICKIPEFQGKIGKKIVWLNDINDFVNYFQENRCEYLPTEIRGVNHEELAEVVRTIHQERIEGKEDTRENIFLSVCIPSYNRGKLAYELVEELRTFFWDAEVEIVVSDNGSDVQKAYYDKIRDLNDSRIRFHRFSKNTRFQGNFQKVLQMAKGKFAILLSDEDHLNFRVLPQFLNLLCNCEGVGMLYANQVFDKTIFCAPGQNAMTVAVDTNYVSGLCFNMEILEQVKAEEFYNRYKNTSVGIYYPHFVYALKVAANYIVARVSIPVIEYGDEYGFNGEILKKKSIHSGLSDVEGRLQQFKDIIMVAERAADRENGELLGFARRFLEKTYDLLFLVSDKMDVVSGERLEWEETCDIVKKKAIEVMKCFFDEGEVIEVVTEINGEKLRQ